MAKSMSGRCFAVFLSLFGSVPTNPACGGTWRQTSFEDFVTGQSDDGGVNLYAAADGTLRTIYSWDYNRDGANDVLFVCGHDNNHAPPAYIFTQTPDGFDPRFRWMLLNDGAYGGTLADLNGDGWTDAVLCGTGNGMNEVALDAIVYYGSERGYARRRSVRLPTLFSRSVAAVDVNGDGLRDLLFAQGRKPGAIVYYNAPEGFDRCRRQVIDCEPASCCQVADVTGDDREDIILLSGSKLLVYPGAREGIALNSPVATEVKGSGRFAVGDVNGDDLADAVVTDERPDGTALVYPGDGKGGFSGRDPLALPNASIRDAAIADLNRDGRAEVIVACFGHDNATGDAATRIYWGADGGPRIDQPTELRTRFASGVTVADVNADGWPDLVAACQRSAESFNSSSFIYMNRNGTFPESERIALPTLGAVASAVGDVDRNGRPDVLFINSTDGTVGLMDSRIYWNDGRGRFSTERMTLIPTSDPFGHFAADLNIDGNLDLVFCGSYEYGRFRDAGSYLYWGDGKGWSPDRRDLIPTQFAMGIVTGDLNRDGWLDLACTQLGLVEDPSKQRKENRCPIFWGSRDGYRKENATWLTIDNPRGLTLGDLNKDGWLEIIATNLTGESCLIFWGSAEGYADTRRSELPVPNKGAVCVSCADINADGWLDVFIVCIFDYSDPGQLTADRYSYVYLGSPTGFDASRRIALPSIGGDQATVADFDRDGRLDVCIGNYTNAERDRTWASFIYYNSPTGFSAARRTDLFTNSGSGNVALDFNRDGWLDIAMACHKMPNGDHRAHSFLFWGGPEGFSDYRKVQLPTDGAHETTFVDAGHIYHRRYEIVYTSAVHDCGTDVRLKRLTWRAQTPHGSSLRFQVRCASRSPAGNVQGDAISEASWRGPAGLDSFFEDSGQDITTTVGGRFVQYRAWFRSADGSNYPTLEDVELEW